MGNNKFTFFLSLITFLNGNLLFNFLERRKTNIYDFKLENCEIASSVGVFIVIS